MRNTSTATIVAGLRFGLGLRLKLKMRLSVEVTSRHEATFMIVEFAEFMGREVFSMIFSTAKEKLKEMVCWYIFPWWRVPKFIFKSGVDVLYLS